MLKEDADKDNRMLKVDADKYGDLGIYLESLSLEDTSNQEPLVLENDSDSKADPQEIEQASQYNEPPIEANLELAAIPTQLFDKLEASSNVPVPIYNNDDLSIVLPY